MGEVGEVKGKAESKARGDRAAACGNGAGGVVLGGCLYSGAHDQGR